MICTTFHHSFIHSSIHWLKMYRPSLYDWWLSYYLASSFWRFFQVFNFYYARRSSLNLVVTCWNIFQYSAGNVDSTYRAKTNLYLTSICCSSVVLFRAELPFALQLTTPRSICRWQGDCQICPCASIYINLPCHFNVYKDLFKYGREQRNGRLSTQSVAPAEGIVSKFRKSNRAVFRWSLTTCTCHKQNQLCWASRKAQIFSGTQPRLMSSRALRKFVDSLLPRGSKWRLWCVILKTHRFYKTSYSSSRNSGLSVTHTVCDFIISIEYALYRRARHGVE